MVLNILDDTLFQRLFQIIFLLSTGFYLLYSPEAISKKERCITFTDQKQFKLFWIIPKHQCNSLFTVLFPMVFLVFRSHFKNNRAHLHWICLLLLNWLIKKTFSAVLVPNTICFLRIPSYDRLWTTTRTSKS